MNGTRRRFFQDAAFFGAGILGWSSRAMGQAQDSLNNLAQGKSHPHAALTNSQQKPRAPFTMPDVPDLPFTLDNGVKVFHLKPQPFKQKIAPFKTIDVWGYNGSCPGPTIQVTQGDRVRIVVENALPESTTMHWHGLEIPIEQDGVPFISQKPIAPGETYTYEFTVHQEGTFFYHAHSAMQEMLGLLGLFIAHPQTPHSPHVDHDFGIVLQEWAVLPNNTVPNSAAMEYNWLTFNGVCSPMTTPLLVRLGSRVRLRFVNLGMDHHPIHLHGHQFVMTGTEGGRAPESTWYPMNTVLVGVAQARVVEFEARYPGAWMLHCHLPHHMMNSMMDLLNNDRMIQTADQTDPKALRQMQTLANTVGFPHVHHSPIADDANATKGFPQDAFMEMGMDAAVAKPETYGLPDNWSAEMMGMMTLIRTLPDQQYDEIMAMKKAAAQPKEGPRDQQS